MLLLFYQVWKMINLFVDHNLADTTLKPYEAVQDLTGNGAMLGNAEVCFATECCCIG